MKKTVTKKQIVELFNGLNAVGSFKGKRFSYVVVKNINTIKPEVDALIKIAEASEEYKEYEKMRIDLAKKYADRDENGEPIIEQGNYKMTTGKKSFEKEFGVLQENNKEVLEEYKAQNKEVEKILSEEVEFDLLLLKEEELPEDITPAASNGIYLIIE